jgi:hypothetical protein
MNAIKTTAIITNLAGIVLLTLSALVVNGNISVDHKGLVTTNAVTVSEPVRSEPVSISDSEADKPAEKVWQIEDLPLATTKTGGHGSSMAKKKEKKLVPCGYRQVGFKSLGDPDNPEPRGVTLLCMK